MTLHIRWYTHYLQQVDANMVSYLPASTLPPPSPSLNRKLYMGKAQFLEVLNYSPPIEKLKEPTSYSCAHAHVVKKMADREKSLFFLHMSNYTPILVVN